MSHGNAESHEIVLLPNPRKLIRTAGTHAPIGRLPERIIDHSIPHEQGYRLSITPVKIVIASRSPAGAWYAEKTLQQIASQFGPSLPCLEVEDWPDFPVRGVMLDISRDKVPTMATLFALVDRLAGWKINQLQLYMEHTFAYSRHRAVWHNASPMTAAEIRELDQYCRARFIDLVPNQNSFGHMERWLKHPQYQHLAEAIDGAETPWGFRWKGPFSLCPTDPEALELLRELYAELLPNFSSSLFNVGCDETFDIGQGRSKAECDGLGVHRVYLNFLGRVNDLVKSHGRRMMFWGDVILHQPELIAELPKELIALQWGYEANHPFDTEGRAFTEAGVPYYVCPGTSSWNSIAGRTDNAIANLRSAAHSGKQHGAIGYLNTDWGDNGHLQYLPISYLPFAAGAAFSWCLDRNQNLDLVAAVNQYAFDDPTGALGRAAYDLGNVYQACKKPNNNGSALFRLLVIPPTDPSPETGLTAENFDATEAAIDAAVLPLHSMDACTAEQHLITDELRNAAQMLRFCVEIGRSKLALPVCRKIDLSGLIAEHRRLWLARNRPGGLEDSAGRLMR
jgi:hypothetical protein